MKRSIICLRIYPEFRWLFGTTYCNITSIVIIMNMISKYQRMLSHLLVKHHTYLTKYLLVQTRFCYVVSFKCYNSWACFFYTFQLCSHYDSVNCLKIKDERFLKEKNFRWSSLDILKCYCLFRMMLSHKHKIRRILKRESYIIHQK